MPNLYIKSKCGNLPKNLTPNDFSTWNNTLKTNRAGQDTVFVDMALIDKNIAAIKSMIGNRFAPRIVTKAMPCVGLIGYVAESFNTNRLMTFSEGVLRDCVQEFGKFFDIMQGRPLPAAAAKRIIDKFGKARTSNVKWLIDTVARAQEYAALNIPMKVCVELECGVQRGGAHNNTELLAIMDIIDKSPLTFAGFMGYDGHVIYAGLTANFPGVTPVTPDEEFARVNTRYQAFIDAAKTKYPTWFTKDTIISGGGTVTLNYYNAATVTPINDLTFGIGVVDPSAFGDILAAFGLSPALYCTTFINKRIDNAELPFVPGLLPSLAVDNPSLQTCFYVNSGAFPGDKVYPQELITSPFLDDSTGGEIFANLGSFYGPASLNVHEGDFVFYRPYEGSASAWLGKLVAIRGTCIEHTWDTVIEQE